MPIRCRCPPDSCTPRSPTLVFKPSDKLSTKNSKWASLIACFTLTKSISLRHMPKATFSAILPSLKNILCGTKPMYCCQACLFFSSIIKSSSINCPVVGAIRPSNRSIAVDLPDPDSPTKPTVELIGIFRFILSNAGIALLG